MAYIIMCHSEQFPRITDFKYHFVEQKSLHQFIAKLYKVNISIWIQFYSKYVIFAIQALILNYLLLTLLGIPYNIARYKFKYAIYKCAFSKLLSNIPISKMFIKLLYYLFIVFGLKLIIMVLIYFPTITEIVETFKRTNCYI